MSDDLESRLVELESRVAFQELALNELSDALASSSLQADRTAMLLERALQDLKQLRTLLYADPGQEPPPPHY